jgi:methylenetetrahydrofolate dehydrogenase (NADP+)/methenyltetrahydrofolate cyclohydrolase
MYKIIDGKQVASDIKKEIAEEVLGRNREGLKVPHLAAVLVGNDGGSETYVANKVKSCEEVGFESTLIRLPDTITEKELIDQVKKLNENNSIDGFIVQLPLPSHINEDRITETILPEKDVDGFHPVNLGRMLLGIPSFISATPYGIMELLKRYNIETKGRKCVVMGRSNIVGRPLSVLLSRKGVDATVTVVHSRSEKIREICSEADILVAALGSPHFVTADMVKEGAVVIDVGTTRVKSDLTKSGWKLTGDVDFESVAPRCSYITPVPGGVGPMTIVSLLRNTLLACSLRK